MIIITQKASLYPILRLILPTKDTERGAYHIQTKTLGNIYVKALAINKNSSAGRKLTGENDVASEDFGDVVFDVMKNRQTEGTLTVYDVNKCLDEMSTKRKGNYAICMACTIGIILRSKKKTIF